MKAPPQRTNESVTDCHPLTLYEYYMEFPEGLKVTANSLIDLESKMSSMRATEIILLDPIFI